MQQPGQKSVEITAVDDWSKLRDAVGIIQAELDSHSEFEKFQGQLVLLHPNTAKVIAEYVPRLLDRYAELWELSLEMTTAWEMYKASQNDLYVPDAQDMVQLHNEGEL